MVHRSFRRDLLAPLALATLATLAGCSSGAAADTEEPATTLAPLTADPASTAPPPTTEAPADAATTVAVADESPATTDAGAATEAVSDEVAVPADVCGLVTAAEVGDVMGEPVTATPEAPDACRYVGSSEASPAPLLRVVAAPDGLAGAQVAAESTWGAPAEAISAAGLDGYLVWGDAAGEPTSEGGVAVGGLLVSVVVASPDAVGNASVILEVLERATTRLVTE